jgi:hypothetical protein
LFVASIETRATLNEETDLVSQNARLKQEIKQLKIELNFFKSSTSGRFFFTLAIYINELEDQLLQVRNPNVRS